MEGEKKDKRREIGIRRILYDSLLCVALFCLTASAQKPHLVVQAGHSTVVHSVAFSPDGRTLASAGDTVKLWDIASGRELRALGGLNGPFVFSPDWRVLATAYDSTIKLWDVASGHELKTLAGHSLNIRSMAFSPDGRTLASSAGDLRIKLWDVETGRDVRTIGSPTGNDWLAFSPDGRALAAAGQTTVLWDAATGGGLRILQDDSASRRVFFSPDGRTLVAELRDAIQLWDVESGKKRHKVEVGVYSSVALSLDGRTLAVGDQETVKLWDVATGNRLRVLRGSHAYLTFSPDGRTLAAAGNSIRLWDVASGRSLATLKESAASIAFSADGRMLASGGDKLKLWDVKRGIGEHAEKVNSVAFSPDGRAIATANQDHTITLWDAARGRTLRTLDETLFDAKCIAFSPDGRTLASGDDAIRLWDVAGGREPRTLPGRGFIESLHFSPDGRMLAASKWHTIEVWDVASGKQLRTLETPGWVHSVAFSPDGRTLVRAADRVELWDVATWRELPTLDHVGFAYFVAFSPDGRKLATAGFTFGLWDLTSGARTHEWPGSNSVKFLAFSSDGATLASGTGDPGIQLWDVTNGRAWKTLGQHLLSINSVAFSPNGRTLASGGDAIALWDVASGRLVRTLVEHGVPVATVAERQTLVGHTSQFTSVLFSSDGRSLAIENLDHTINRWDLAKGRILQTGSPADSKSTPVAFSPDGRALANVEGTVLKIRDIDSGRELQALSDNDSKVTAAAFSPDGSIIASGAHKIKLWNVASGHLVHTLAGHTGKAQGSSSPMQRANLPGRNGATVAFTMEWKHLDELAPGTIASALSVAFDPKGRILASASNDDTIKLWDVSTEQELHTLTGHAGWVRCVAFSPDGGTLASGGDDFTVRLWDVGTGREQRALEGHADRLAALAFSPDGHTLASGSSDGIIRLWDAADGHLLRILSANSVILSLAFRQNGKVLASGHKDAVRFWDTTTGGELLAIFTFDRGAQWLIADSEGHFDAGNLERITGLSWVFPDEPFRALAPEIFVRDYYVPRLLLRVLGGEQLPKVRPLQDLNRVQPSVAITSVRQSASPDVASVTVELSQEQFTRDGSTTPIKSGAYDLRLFRAGQLVAQEPEPKPGIEDGQEKGAALTAEFLQAWRADRRVTLDPATGKATKTFQVRLPHGQAGHEIEFTAYAFNEDRVKSATAKTSYQLPAELGAAPRRAYLITMGVNANQSHNLNLELAVSSAEKVRALLRDKLGAQYPKPVEIPLYSDLDADSNQVKLKTASKADLRAVLDLLAGRPVEQGLRDEVDPKHQVSAAGPDDAVTLYVASHGYADPQGTFFLMPYDTGSNWGITEDVLTRCRTNPDSSPACRQAQDFLGHSVSSSDLAAWWSGIDAGEMVMMLDSCHSGAVPGKEFRPGPLGDPGFGQLSYDKGMVILSASQRAQTERGEWVTGGEGRTLLVDALETVARVYPQRTLQQWLHDTEEELPVTARRLYPAFKDEDVQLPMLLDFAKAAVQ